MAVTNPVAIPVQQGDTIRLRFEPKAGDAPLDLTGAVVEFSVAKAAGKTPSWSWLSNDGSGRVEIVDGGAGQVIAVTLYRDDSRAWGKLEEVEWECTVDFAPHTELRDPLTIARGTFEVATEVVKDE